MILRISLQVSGGFEWLNVLLSACRITLASYQLEATNIAQLSRLGARKTKLYVVYFCFLAKVLRLRWIPYEIEFEQDRLCCWLEVICLIKNYPLFWSYRFIVFDKTFHLSVICTLKLEVKYYFLKTRNCRNIPSLKTHTVI